MIESRETARSNRKAFRTVSTVIASAILLVVYLVPRLMQLDRMLNTDEVDWLGASANVYIGLSHGDLASTFQLPHPGLPTIWAGVLAFLIEIPHLPVVHPQALAGIHAVHNDLRAIGADPLHMLIVARIVKIGLEAFVFLICAAYLVRLFGLAVAALTSLLLALDPFIIGQDRFLHIDGMAAITSFAAVLSVTYALRDRTASRLWAFAGVLSALAWLTRFTTGVIGVIAVIAIVAPPLVASLRREERLRRTLDVILIPLLVYLVAAGLTSVLLWPAVVVEPHLVFDQIRQYATNAAVVGHELPIFFDGRVVYGDPGVRFYPEAILWRLTPVILVGVVIAVVLGVGRAVKRAGETSWSLMATVLIPVSFALMYVALMDAGAKKFDRYVLPAFPVLDLVAAIGWVALVRLVRRSRNQWRQMVSIVLLGAVIVAQGAAAWSDRPYANDYYNPLLGGLPGAEHSMLVGWGEGLDQAAGFILGQPGGETASVRTSANDVTLLYFMPDTVQVRGDGGFPHGPRGIASWARTDYYVAYTLQWQRDLDAIVLPYLASQPTLHTVRIDGVPFARVYDLRTTPPSPALMDELSCRWSFGNQTTLLTFSDRSIKVNPDDPNLRELALYFQSDVAGPLDVSVALVSRDGTNKTIRTTGTIPPGAGPGVIRTALTKVTLPRGGTTDYYWIDVTVTDPSTGRTLTAAPLADPGAQREAASANNCPNAGAVNQPF